MSSQIQDGAHYYILNIVGSLVLDLDHGNSSSGTPVKGWTPYFDHVATNRVWQFKKRDNWWEVQNVQGGTVLTLKNGSSDNGTPIFGEYSFGGDRQLWRFDRSAKSSQVTYWTIVNKDSNTVVDLDGGKGKDGTKVQGWGSLHNTNQKWILVPANSYIPILASDILTISQEKGESNKLVYVAFRMSYLASAIRT